MAASTPSSSVSTINRFCIKPKKPLDVWSTREKLCLASAVFKIGDQNWVSVSRTIKPYVDPKRPPEWFHQKNCVSQYYDMLEQLEQPKRKRGDRSESDTPSLQIMRKMTIERSEQLKKEIMDMQQTFKQLKAEVEIIKDGQWDSRLQEEWESIKAEQRIKEEAEAVKVHVTDDADQDDTKDSVTDVSDFISLPTDADETTQDSVCENVDISGLTDEEANQTSTPTTASTLSSSIINASPGIASKPQGCMLSSLLISDVKSATGLQQLKNEQEHGHQQKTSAVTATCPRSLLKTPITQDDVLTFPPSSSAPTLSRLLSTAKGPSQSATTVTTPSSSISTLSTSLIQPDRSTLQGTAEDFTASKSKASSLGLEREGISLLHRTDKLNVEEAKTSSINTTSTPIKTEIVNEEVKDEVVVTTEEIIENVVMEEEVKDFGAEIDIEAVKNIKEETDKDSQDEDFETSVKSADIVQSETELTECFVKDEPLSPTSSISSRISETGSKKGSRSRGRPRGSRISRIGARKSNTDDERKDDGGSSKHSDVELSEDEVRDVDDLLAGVPRSANASSILSESFPNSPASLSMCSDTEEEKSFKQWKKSIMLVWRAAATHKFANVFLHPVTDEIAPGYKSVVLRPMDLSTIKKNVETGLIRTTVEFQRDMMLMFSNAIMYNSSDHNVYRMAQDMYDDVMQHIEEEESKKRRLSVDHAEGGKSKKRKTRLDESLP